MSRNLVSIIITTKNSSRTLEALLKSIKNQSYEQSSRASRTKSIEIIVVDNSSTDQTKEIASFYTKKIYKKGPERSAQRNFGVSKAKGKYVFILDSDMELQKRVVSECVKVLKNKKLGALIVPEKSFGIGFWTQFKVFEREFYVGEDNIEAARFFRKKLFKKFGGYDLLITGPEDWDLPLRMKKSGVKIGRIKSYILHNELTFSPWRSAKKKFYYATGASVYLKRHPEMVLSQGNLLFRSVFIRKWRKLLSHPFLAVGMICVKILEAIGAMVGVLISFKVLKNEQSKIHHK